MKRTMYCITGPHGQYLTDLANSQPVFSHIAIDALDAQMAWLNSTAAIEAWSKAQAALPGLELGVAVLELAGVSGGQWQVVSTQTFVPRQTTRPLIP